jgi:hypothetical protein
MRDVVTNKMPLDASKGEFASYDPNLIFINASELESDHPVFEIIATASFRVLLVMNATASAQIMSVCKNLVLAGKGRIAISSMANMSSLQSFFAAA